ncbi:hypothetical protein Anas_02617 [Armadillidium nasatum]|uniref:Uncharacterized protein n=1 Tax=Armadillidium nasatum TaxID=96803 RepID=A0A5N5TII8_9CRUS|nr:hypothetical protein Anas_02617 [Armadillidium nasatum]
MRSTMLENENCYHDWIWGLCSECGLALSAADLREHFSPSVLVTCKSLPCFLCSSSSNPEANIEPLFRLKLCLEDVVNDNRFLVDLCGDHAEEFFETARRFTLHASEYPSLPRSEDVDDPASLIDIRINIRFQNFLNCRFYHGIFR